MLRTLSVLLAFATAGASAQVLTFVTSPVDASQEVPPNGSTATGTVTGTLDTATNTFSWTVTFSGLTTPQTAAHFHGPALAGQNAGIQIDIGLGSPNTGSSVVTSGQSADILAGLWYVNIHTTMFPGGEIRGQLVPTLDLFADIGLGKPGVAGIPVASGTGPLTAGSSGSLTLASAAPSSTTNLFFGVGLLAAPFKGGVLGPTNDILITGLPTDGAGGLTLPFGWPAGIPANTNLFYQFWTSDPAATQDLSASNTVRMTAQ